MMTQTRNLFLPMALAMLVGLPALAQEATAPHVPLQKTIGQVTATGPVPSLAVMNATGATLADGKLTLTGIAPNTIVFADRPVRAAGHVMTSQFLMQWDEGKDSFAADPPNATVSVLDAAPGVVSDAVVELIKPVLDGSTLTFEVTVLEGALSGSGPAAVFIDDFRGGGGGFHAGAGSFTGPRGGTVDYAHAGGYAGGAISSNYWHAPDYHGAWYGAAPVVGAAVAGAAVGAAVADGGYGGGYAYPPYCGYYPYPPCY
jgi:hypothetical protein